MKKALLVTTITIFSSFSVFAHEEWKFHAQEWASGSKVEEIKKVIEARLWQKALWRCTLPVLIREINYSAPVEDEDVGIVMDGQTMFKCTR